LAIAEILFQRSDSLPGLAFGISMLRVSMLDGSLDGLAMHLVVGGGSGRDCPSPEQSLCFDHALERSLDGRGVGEQLQPL
jgi:hypothetical protein